MFDFACLFSIIVLSYKVILMLAKAETQSIARFTMQAFVSLLYLGVWLAGKRFKQYFIRMLVLLQIISHFSVLLDLLVLD